jgi:glutamine amidotransferase-like uncharacterized protein
VAGAQSLTYELWNLQQNRDWMASRQPDPTARVGVFADYGVWNVGARSLVQVLEDQGIACRVFDRTGLNAAGLNGLSVLLFPGGLAPAQYQAAGPEGLEAVEAWVRGGGRLVAICAGSYLVAREVRYDGVTYPYPTMLFDGVADGPVPGLARYPRSGPAELKVTDEGRARGLTATVGLYGSGPRFLGGTGVTVLARYVADGSPALISRTVGKGEVVCTGVHFERPLEGGDTAPPPPEAAATLRALLQGSFSPAP